MGSAASSKLLTAPQLADAVTGLGDAYSPYGELIVKNGLSGEFLADQVKTDEDFFSVCADIGISNKLHKNVLCATFKKAGLLSNGLTRSPSNPVVGDRAKTPTAPSTLAASSQVTIPPKETFQSLFKIQGIDLDPQDVQNGGNKISDAVKERIDKWSGDQMEFDCFISYRVAADADIAEKFYLLLKSNGLNPFWDRKCLVHGEDWKTGFIRGLNNSKCFISLISSKAVAMLKDRCRNHTWDNYLLEIETALRMKTETNNPLFVVPVLIGEYIDVPGAGRLLKKFNDFDASQYADSVGVSAAILLHQDEKLLAVALKYVIDNAEDMKELEDLVAAGAAGNVIAAACAAVVYAAGSSWCKLKEDATRASQLIKDGFESLQNKAEMGNHVAQCLVGWIYSRQNMKNNPEEAAKWLKLAADQGNGIARQKLGLAYSKGDGVPKDEVEAVKWFRLSADLGNPMGQNSLALRYRDGNGVDKNLPEAVRLLRLAAEQGYMNAMNSVGLCHEKGDGVPQNYAEAMACYKLAADRGNLAAMKNIGTLYEKGLGVAKNVPEAIKWYRMAAEQGSETAQNSLGLLYLNGTGVTKDVVEAAKWFKLAAVKGNTIAMKYLGDMAKTDKNYTEAMKWYRMGADKNAATSQNGIAMLYDDGLGVAKDRAEAVKWYRMAADQGHAWGQYSLGVKYRDGAGVAQDLAEAARLFRLAAAQGIASAQAELGWALENGRGVTKSDTEAISWYRKAAEQGNAKGQYNLGRGYKNASGGLAKNEAEGVNWTRKAADQGFADAINSMGAHYYSGTCGVKQNSVEAFKLFKLAAEKGNFLAMNNLGILLEGGNGCQKNVQEAAKYYRMAFDKGNANAGLSLVTLYETGNGVAQNFGEAKKILDSLAAKGDEAAKKRLKEKYGG